tara:strand:- start:2563 stop:3015 length:453 start_codon:yes stop_codon:yes gene_type:complete
MDYRKLKDYDIQSDYIDKLTDKEKLELFRSLDDGIQDIADKIWNREANYSEKFMIDWISSDYSKAILTICEKGEFEFDKQHMLDITFINEFKDYKKYGDSVNDENDNPVLSFCVPTFWLDVPCEFLDKWAIDEYIDPDDVKFIESIRVNG